jgi:hypothetical protein
MDSINRVSDVVRQTVYDLHVYHSTGHLEKIFENGLARRLRKREIEVELQAPGAKSTRLRADEPRSGRQADDVSRPEFLSGCRG